MIDPERLSDYEFCPTYERLYRQIEPPRYPVRDRMKVFFKLGVQKIKKAERNVPERVSEAFLDAAAAVGFEYPPDNWLKDHGNHPASDVYTIANDYCSWLEGALHLVKEQMVPGFHLWRVVDRFDFRLRWPDLMALAEGQAATVHYFRLPALRHGRLHSPLVLAHQHPLTKACLLATSGGEQRFNNNWKKIARWELRHETDWSEWRYWIERDQCMGSICQERELEPISQDSAEMIVEDALAIEHSIENQSHPRRREACERGCMFMGYCHGSGKGFTPLRTQPSAKSLPDRESEAVG
jgi:hypothetical protein